MPRPPNGILAGTRGPSNRCSTKHANSFAAWPRPSIHEHHGLAAVQDHAIRQMVAYRPRQYPAFDIAALAHQIVGGIAMADALDVLVDDRAFIECAGDVMRGGADQLDAALMRLMVGPRALEAWQKRMMDVDATTRQFRGHFVRQYLHVACQHHKVGFGLTDQIPDRGLLLAPGLLRHRQVVKRDLTEFEIAVGLALMIGDDGGWDHFEFAGPPAIQDIGEAMIGFRG